MRKEGKRKGKYKGNWERRRGGKRTATSCPRVDFLQKQGGNRAPLVTPQTLTRTHNHANTATGIHSTQTSPTACTSPTPKVLSLRSSGWLAIHVARPTSPHASRPCTPCPPPLPPRPPLPTLVPWGSTLPCTFDFASTTSRRWRSTIPRRASSTLPTATTAGPLSLSVQSQIAT